MLVGVSLFDHVRHVQVDIHRANAPRQGFGQLPVHEGEQLVATFDQMHIDAQRRKHAGVFAADNAAARDQHAVRQVVNVEDGVGIVDPRIMERQDRRVMRIGARGDQEHVALYMRWRCVFRRDRNRVIVDEGRETAVERDAVAFDVVGDTTVLALHDETLAVEKIAGGYLVLEFEVDAVEPPLAKSRKVERRFA